MAIRLETSGETLDTERDLSDGLGPPWEPLEELVEEEAHQLFYPHVDGINHELRTSLGQNLKNKFLFILLLFRTSNS